MKKHSLTMVCSLLAVAGLAYADSLPAGRLEPATERCASQISAMRGVWRSQQVFLPAYGDLDLVMYMASLSSEAGVTVLPVLSPESFYFRSNHIVFLSTAFILHAGSERELLEAIRNARVEVRTRDLPACSAIIPWEPATFATAQQRLAGQLAGYQDVTVRRLRIRGPEGQ